MGADQESDIHFVIIVIWNFWIPEGPFSPKKINKFSKMDNDQSWSGPWINPKTCFYNKLTLLIRVRKTTGFPKKSAYTQWPPSEQWWKTDQKWNHPCNTDHHTNSFGCPFDWIGKWLCDRPIAIQRNYADMQNGSLERMSTLSHIANIQIKYRLSRHFKFIFCNIL